MCVKKISSWKRICPPCKSGFSGCLWIWRRKLQGWCPVCYTQVETVVIITPLGSSRESQRQWHSAFLVARQQRLFKSLCGVCWSVCGVNLRICFMISNTNMILHRTNGAVAAVQQNAVGYVLAACVSPGGDTNNRFIPPEQKSDEWKRP